MRPPPISTLFPYTTLFRSERLRGRTPEGDEIRVAGRRHETAAHVHHGGVDVVPGFEHAAAELLNPHGADLPENQDRKSTRLNSSHSQISYAVFCLKKKNNQ